MTTTRNTLETFRAYTRALFLRHDDYKGIVENGPDYISNFADRLDEVRQEPSIPHKQEMLAELAQEIREEAQRADILSIETETLIDVMLGVGGPTTYIRFFARKNGDVYEWTRNAEFITTDTEDGHRATRYMSAEETDQMWQDLGLEYWNN